MLKQALKKLFGKEGRADDEWINQMSYFIMDFFGYEDRILDNQLTPKDRDIFYMLEGVDLLKTEMEEATLQKGKIWRIHYWVLNRNKIEELIEDEEEEEEDMSGGNERTIYDNLSDGFWPSSTWLSCWTIL